MIHPYQNLCFLPIVLLQASPSKSEDHFIAKDVSLWPHEHGLLWSYPCAHHPAVASLIERTMEYNDFISTALNSSAKLEIINIIWYFTKLL